MSVRKLEVVSSAQTDGPTVWINDKPYVIQNATMTLNQFLRQTLGLTGTKVMCAEGGCGACVVHVRRPLPTDRCSGEQKVEFVEHSVNSCLVLLMSCVGWRVTTIEALSNDRYSLHAIQDRVREYHGTQCGFCTPGFCMQQYSTLRRKAVETTSECDAIDIENSFDGNICRCTGYRSILDAMKSFVNDKSSSETETERKADKKVLTHIGSEFVETKAKSCIQHRPASGCVGRNAWYSPETLREFRKIVNDAAKADCHIKIIAGNTGEGVYKTNPSSMANTVSINIGGVRELYQISTSTTSVELGALVTLSSVITIFERHAKKVYGFRYLNDIAQHLRHVANQSVRNLATWAGNLAMKAKHPEFPSDVATCLEAAQAQVVMMSITNESMMSVGDLLHVDFSDDPSRLILRLVLKPIADNASFSSFKIAERDKNSLAYVNGALLFPFIRGEALQISEQPSIVFGGLGPRLLRARRTERALTGLSVTEWNAARTLVFEAFSHDLLDVESASNYAIASSLNSNGNETNVLDEYRANLARHMLYKALLRIYEEKAPSSLKLDLRLKSAWYGIKRPESSGTQNFDTYPQEWPLTKPVLKVEGHLQTTGKAKFISDMTMAGCLYAVPILSPAGPARLKKFDVTRALDYQHSDGGRVRRILTAADIPGENNFMPLPFLKERLLVNDDILRYAGEPLAILVADTPQAAKCASRLVKIEYEMLRKPILTCEDAIVASSFHEPHDALQCLAGKDVDLGNVEQALADSDHVISGTVRTDAQYHFTMETHVSIAEPRDDGEHYVVLSATQWPDGTASSIAQLLGVSANRVEVQVQRIGGGFGCKQNRAAPVACMAAIGACATLRPVKMHLSLQDNMKMLGTRHPYLAKYRAGFNTDGKLRGVDVDIYFNMGVSGNDFVSGALGWQNCALRLPPDFRLRQHLCDTDMPTATVMRGPGMTEAQLTIDTIFEHAAHQLGMDSLELRRRNLLQNGDPLRVFDLAIDRTFLPNIDTTDISQQVVRNCTAEFVLEQLLEQSDHTNRKHEIDRFNCEHRWRKRALSTVIMSYGIAYDPWFFPALVDVHYNDGSISISHGGVEMGQGINTKAAQTCAHAFASLYAVPMENINIRTCSTLTSANAVCSAASITSEMVCYAVSKCCEAIRERLKNFQLERSKKFPLESASEWMELVHACRDRGMDLSERYWARGFDCVEKQKKNYAVYGAAATEVELDVLTGERQVRRMDVVYDVGQSVSPQIDIGQAEGGIIMGLGMFMSEKYERDARTGALLTNSTWHYKPPGATDIPVDLRVSFLKNAAANESGVQRSKAIGEPPLLMSASVMLALRAAVLAARKELNNDEEWIDLDAPATPERLQLACGVKPVHLIM